VLADIAVRKGRPLAQIAAALADPAGQHRRDPTLLECQRMAENLDVSASELARTRRGSRETAGRQDWIGRAPRD
jgi:hypothetical protein